MPSLGETTGKRTSKVDGKRVKVPADMNYTEWKKIYVDKSKTFEQWQSEHTPRNYKADIAAIKQTYQNQKAAGASAAELEKTIKSAGKLTIDEVKKIKLYDLPPNEKIDIDLLGKTLVDFAGRVKKLRGKISSEEENKLFVIWLSLGREYNDFKTLAETQKLTIYQKRSEQVKNILAQVREMGATPQQLQKQFGKSKSQIRATVESAVNCYPREWVEMSANRGALKLKKVKRGHYSDRASELTISGEGGKAYATAVHEFGHRMEHTFSDILSAEKEFYTRRTAGEKLESLARLTGNTNYRSNERARKDKFLKVYMGKDYGGSAYELVSMGFQYAFTDIEKLLLDEDMAEWIFGLLAIV